MKKITTFLIATIVASSMLFSQESTFNVGDKVLNLGVGFGSIGYGGLYYKTTIPPISISGEYGIKDGILEKGVIGVGGYAGFSSYKWHYTAYGYDYGWRYTNVVIAARGVFHYPLIDKLDTYTGLMLGLRLVMESDFGDNIGGGVTSTAAGTGPVFSWFAGGRYYLTDKVAVMGEIGYGISWLNLGVALKL